MTDKRDDADARKRAEIVRLVAANKVAANKIFFAHRHSDESAEFHPELIGTFHSAEPQVVGEAFRGGAKTTSVEEVVALEGALQGFNNALVVGPNEDMGKQRLAAIKQEFEQNSKIIDVFGNLVGSIWGETKIVLRNGRCIQAIGKGQSVRGTKHLKWRPDFCVIDDFEDDETVATEAQRIKGVQWLYRTLIPAMDKHYRIRFLGNRLDPDAVIVRVSRDPNWRALRYPIMVPDENGEAHEDLPAGKWRPTWKSRFPISWIAAKRAEYQRLNMLREFNNEYMCEAEVPEEKAFRPAMIHINENRVRGNEAVFAMVESAETIKGKAGVTATAVWSWIGSKLVVWEATERLMMPDEIVAEIGRIDDTYQPVMIGVEENAYNEFLAAPLRDAIAKRGQAIPFCVERGRIEKDKADFIRGLQPYFNSHNVEFARPMPKLAAQLMAHPTGNCAIASALAFATVIRPLIAVYDDFTLAHIAEEIDVDRTRTRWLAMNATGSMVAAALVQYTDGVRILRDWVVDGDAGAHVARIIAEASLEGEGKVKPCICTTHFDRRNAPIGLATALSRVPIAINRMPEPIKGRQFLRASLSTNAGGEPSFQVAKEARWTVNALHGGYGYYGTEQGRVREEAREGPYQLLMEAIESFMAQLKGSLDEADLEPQYAQSRDGRRYLTSMARR